MCSSSRCLTAKDGGLLCGAWARLWTEAPRQSIARAGDAAPQMVAMGDWNRHQWVKEILCVYNMTTWHKAKTGSILHDNLLFQKRKEGSLVLDKLDKYVSSPQCIKARDCWFAADVLMANPVWGSKCRAAERKGEGVSSRFKYDLHWLVVWFFADGSRTTGRKHRGSIFSDFLSCNISFNKYGNNIERKVSYCSF